MRKTNSFRDILQRKIANDRGKTPYINPDFNLVFTMNSLGWSPPMQVTTRGYATIQNQWPIKFQRPIRPEGKKASWSTLSEQQKTALKNIIDMGADLLENSDIYIEKLKSEYRKLVKIWHPDFHDEKTKSIATEKFIQLQSHFDFLKNLKSIN